MEKNKQIFETSLDSLLDTPIEVDGIGENYMQDVIPAKENKKDPTLKKEEVNETAGMIDLNASGETDDEEVEEEVTDDEEISEDPSSSKESPQKSNKSKTSSPLTPYAKLLVDEGVLPNLDLKEFDGTAESLKEAMIVEIMGAVDMYKDSLPARIKSFINNYEDGIPLEKLLDIDRSEVQLDSITEDKLEEDVDLQKQVVSDYLKRSTKFSDKRIAKMIETMEDSGELEDEAKTSMVELKEILESEKTNEKKYVAEQQKLMEENRKKEITALHEKIRTTTEIVPGIKLNDKVKNNVLQSMTQPVGYDQTGRPVNRIVAARMENPVEFELRLHYLFEITKGFTDFSKLAEKGRKDASKAFEAAVEELDVNRSEGTETHRILGPKSKDFLKGLEKTFKL
jgi:hypothetical protein